MPPRAFHQHLSPIERLRLGPVLADAVNFFRSPEAMKVPYALIPSLEWPRKPLGFASIAALARHIHRQRGDDALELQTQQLQFQDRTRDVVEVLAIDVGGRARRIGLAWINGQHWRVLEAALTAQIPNARAEAA
jgi:hypothetical protein